MLRYTKSHNRSMSDKKIISSTIRKTEQSSVNSSSQEMTYRQVASNSESSGPTSANGPERALNCESTWDERECQKTIAHNARLNSGTRNDVDQTTDLKAFDEMFDFIKSDTKTLDKHKNSEVASFYAGRSIFVTGASGFVGKCLLEKLLRSCPDLKTVFILMRPKRGQEVGERVETLVRSELFNRLRNSTNGSEQLNKIRAVKGDITKPLFGLSNEDIETLNSNVSLIFHSAATVKFVEPLKVAVENNVVSVENLINLASKLLNLEALVHVSTAYSNCDRNQVDEVLYESPIEADKLIDMSQWMKPEMLEEISPVLLGKRPNTYTFTKAVAESLLVERSKKLLPNIPIAMVRPSIVAGIWRQPICGWVDNFNGPTGVILSMMTGAIQAMVACPNYCADIVPVDIVANLIICTAWQVHRQHHGRARRLSDDGELAREDSIGGLKENKDISVFNCVSGTLNAVVWRDFAKYMKQIALVYPCNHLIRRPGTLLLSNQYVFNVFNFINHTAVAYTGDFVLKLAGKKPKLVIIYKRMMKMINTLKPFTTNQWLFNCSNVTCLYERLSPIDKEIFNFDIRQLRWDDYLRRYYVGSKIFALKDDPKQVVKSRHKLNRMQWASRFIQTLFLLTVYYFLLGGTIIEKYAIETIQQTFDGIDLISLVRFEHIHSTHTP